MVTDDVGESGLRGIISGVIVSMILWTGATLNVRESFVHICAGFVVARISVLVATSKTSLHCQLVFTVLFGIVQSMLVEPIVGLAGFLTVTAACLVVALVRAVSAALEARKNKTPQ